MEKLIKWIKENKPVVAAIGVGLFAVIVIIVLIVVFYEPPLKQGKIVDILTTTDKVLYDQHSDDHYRNVKKYRMVTKYRTDSAGNQQEYREQEEYTERVFDHTEYYIERHFDGADFIVVIEGYSTKHPDKLLTNKIWITESRYTSIKDMRGQTLFFDENLGDRRYDFNNSAQEVDRQWYSSFDLIRWMEAHGVSNTQ